jgi:hypothetical protein
VSLRCKARVESPRQRFDRWLSKHTCPANEPGAPMVNTWIKSAANACKLMGVEQADAEEWIRAALARREKSPREVAWTVQRTYQSELTGPPTERTVEPAPAYDPDLLTRYASMVPFEVTDDWLAERSPECVLDAGPDLFLRTVYQPGEHVPIVTAYRNGGYKMEGTWSHDEKPDALDYLRTGKDAGVWYNCQPVRPGSVSWSEPNVDSWHYGILESDKAPTELWLRAVVLMRLPIVAIYTSGGRSIHCLYRIGAESKADFDAKVVPIKRELAPLGADPRAMTAVRLTRLPGCMRGSKSQLQKLLYLDPEPTGEAVWKP